MTNTREIVLDILLLSETEGRHSHELLNAALKKYAYLSKQDRAFISVLVHGTLERRLSIDYIIERYSRVKIKKMKPLIKTLLRLSVYQIIYMDRVPDSAVCNEAVKLASKRGFFGLKGFVNALLRKISQNKDGQNYPDISLKYSMPEWIVSVFLQNYSMEETISILESFLERADISLRVNTSKIAPKDLEKKLEIEGIKIEKSSLLEEVFYVAGFDSMEKLQEIIGEFGYIQEIGSVLAVKLAGIKKGDTVIDVCASPGGKSIHAADILAGSGKVLSFDLSEEKLERLKGNIEKSGFFNIYTDIADARSCREEFLEKADLLIADLPCSGLGTIGRKPDIKYRLDFASVENLVLLQREILDNVCKYVKKGGRILFSTCTLNPEENEENFRYFLEKHREFKPVDIQDCINKELGDSGAALLKKYFRGRACLQLLPGVDSGFHTGGFFISLAERV